MRTDIILVQKFQRGNFAAFWELYERYLDKIYVYIARRVSAREQAEDICSQVWMKALRDLETSQKEEDFLFQPWIYRIAHNAVIDWYRTRKEEVSDEVLECIPYHNDIEKELQDCDALERVLEFMDGLKDTEKNILFLRLWDEMSYKEIAEFVWKSEAACKQVVKRGIEKLRANIFYTCFFLATIILTHAFFL